MVDGDCIKKTKDKISEEKDRTLKQVEAKKKQSRIKNQDKGIYASTGKGLCQ